MKEDKPTYNHRRLPLSARFKIPEKPPLQQTEAEREAMK